ncbi:hypothetical protein Q765_05115 [Flavobacterium rivuli WB 3.3-2 = DSM 21788]|uniref:Uncharacterized protein n=1 Tax=Flavobacterium rivuli WB 3.3-2 = DSM 21788 TaxID=1121895 RepID=A0A0A2M8A8_9FLAO|nr:hypothetical protein Q765_05115 [Flavobacterium rivuli WB 3.3-2 = DSM 21788]
MSYINKFTTKITKFFTRDTKLYVYRPVSGYKEHEAEAQSLVFFNSENGIAIIAYFVKKPCALCGKLYSDNLYGCQD